MRRAQLLAVALLAVAPSAYGQELAGGGAAEVRFIDAEPRGPSVAERMREIRERIQEAVVYPPLARKRRVEGEALVRFEIGRDGGAQEVSLFRTSGTPSLDRAATRAVAAAAPLPWVYGRLEVPVRFELEARHGRALPDDR